MGLYMVAVNLAVCIFVAVAPMLAGDDLRVLRLRGQANSIFDNESQVLKPGSRMPIGATVVLGQGGAITLLSSAGGIRELRAPGAYKTDTLFINRPTSSTLSRVARFVYDNSYERSSAASELGTVYRSQSVVPVWPPDMITDSFDVTLRWSPIPANDALYKVLFSDDEDSIVFTAVVRDTCFHVDATLIPWLSRGECLYWTVQMEDDPASTSRPRCISVSTREEAKEFASYVQQVNDECYRTYEPEAQNLCAVLRGALYEEQGYYEHARKAYESEMSDGHDTILRELLEKCLQRGLQ